MSSWCLSTARNLTGSISDHMCRMALMAMMVPSTADRPLDIARCVQVCDLNCVVDVQS